MARQPSRNDESVALGISLDRRPQKMLGSHIVRHNENTSFS
jgi:hypothetical protein